MAVHCEIFGHDCVVSDSVWRCTTSAALEALLNSEQKLLLEFSHPPPSPYLDLDSALHMISKKAMGNGKIVDEGTAPQNEDKQGRVY